MVHRYSGAGKSTIANIVERKLHEMGRHTYLLDGDNVRHGLNKDLGFTDADRIENIRRVSEVASLMLDAGLIVLASFISPFEAERRMARERVRADEFVEVHVDTTLAVAEARDRKGLYQKARLGIDQLHGHRFPVRGAGGTGDPRGHQPDLGGTGGGRHHRAPAADPGHRTLRRAHAIVNPPSTARTCPVM